MKKTLFSVKNFISSREFVFLLLILIIGLFLRSNKLKDWPISVDEAAAISLARDMVNGRIPLFSPVNDYQGPMKLYAMMPAIFLFGSNIFYIRFSVMLFSVFSIFVFYFFVKKLYDSKIALLSCFIWAILPADVILVTQAWEFPIVNFFVVSFLYVFLKYSETKNKNYLYLVAFIAGLAVMTRLTFLFFFASFIITFKLNPFLSFSQFRKNIKKKNLPLLVLFFVIGVSPMLYWNFLNNFATINFVSNNAPITYGNENLLNIKDNLVKGYSSFVKYLDIGSKFATFETLKMLNSGIFFVSFLVFVIFIFKNLIQKKYFDYTKKNLFILLNFLLITLFISLITVTNFRTDDFSLTFPFYSIILSWTLVYCINLIKKWKIVLTLFVIFLLSFSTIELVNSYGAFVASDKNNLCNLAIDALVKNFSASNTTLVFDVSKYKIFYAFYEETRNSTILQPHDINSSQLSENWRNLMQSPNNEYIFMTNLCLPPWAKDLNIYKNFADFVSAYHKKLIIENITTSDGQELFRVAKLI